MKARLLKLLAASGLLAAFLGNNGPNWP